MNLDTIRTSLFTKRYQLLLISILMMMFDSLLFKSNERIYERYIWPLNMMLYGTATSPIIIADRKPPFYTLLVIAILTPFLYIFSQSIFFDRTVIFSYLSLHTITLINIVKGIFKSRMVSFHMILGAFCGYLLLGLIASFLHMALLSYSHEAIEGLSYFTGNNRNMAVFSNIMYYSFITMTSIGYGDIFPTTISAKMLSVFIGIIGQFYITVIIALIIGKHLNQKT